MSNKDEEGVLGAESVAMTDSSSERMAKRLLRVEYDG